ncbi:hypothetical protein EVAR_62088_1 [Eumeta japonica]|uniref:Uncharacterized protein n=1 Tax=Eumeta variegata TaxID=151549 RepID=A0A4C1YYP0_EUMVA|nr:hypothetical protein EVAR_62088_1 [Eumeta japonica]
MLKNRAEEMRVLPMSHYRRCGNVRWSRDTMTTTHINLFKRAEPQANVQRDKKHVTRARRTASADWWITPGTAGMRPRDLFTTSRDYRESVGVIFH